MTCHLFSRLFPKKIFLSSISYTGIRVGELIALKWKDIEFLNQTISIPKRTTIQTIVPWSINYSHTKQENHGEKLS